MVAGLRMDESISRFLVENNRTYRKHHDRGYCPVHRFQERDLNRVRPVPYAARIHPDWRNSLCAYFGIFLGADSGYRRGKVDIRLSPSLRVSEIVSSISGWKMPCSIRFVHGHFGRVARSSHRAFIAAVRGCDTSRDHTPFDLPVRSSSRRKHTRFHGTGIPSGSVCHICVEVRMGLTNLRFWAADGLLRGTIPSKSSASSILGCRKCSPVYRVYSGVSRGPASTREHQLLLLLPCPEFCWRVDTFGGRSPCFQVC